MGAVKSHQAVGHRAHLAGLAHDGGSWRRQQVLGRRHQLIFRLPQPLAGLHLAAGLQRRRLQRNATEH
jgi:hypothetical protein